METLQKDMIKFINTFNTFVNHVGKVIPPDGQMTYKKLYFGMSMMSNDGIHKFFMDTTEKYQNQILSEDDSFIENIQQEFPILQYYKTMSDESKKSCLSYMKVLYLMAYKLKE